MKYKPCCSKRCMVAGCETKEQGACYCICRLHDYIDQIQSVIDGNTLCDGMCYKYIPNNDYRKKVYDSWSEEKKEFYKKFKEIECPLLLEKYKNKLKEFEIIDF